jgi:AbrB family looped-hinge helix DNA binding protein
MMYEASSKLSSKGQVVVPAEIRKQFSAQEGDSLKFIVDDNGEIKVEIVRRKAILDLFGSIQAKGNTEDFEKVRQESRDEHDSKWHGETEK